MKWIRPNTITGPVAQGKKYFRRDELEDKIWNQLSQGNSVLFLAPRRVGKSSIVSFMADNPSPDLICKYEVIQSVDTIQEFYERLIDMIRDSLTTLGKGKEWFSYWWDSWTIKSLGKDKIDIGNKDIDYRKTFFDLLEQLKANDERVVLFLDEFPDVVLNIYKRDGENNATQLLNDIRTLCHDEKFKSAFVFVLLGSVGLSHVVKKITGRNDKINQLHTEYLPPLSMEQSRDFMDFLLNGASMVASQSVREFLLDKIGNFIPYYIQLLIEECDDILKSDNRPDLTPKDINDAYNKLLKKNDKFEDWDSRLSDYFNDIYPFLNKVLSICADQNGITPQEVYNTSVEYRIELQWKANLDDILIADGYIHEIEGKFYFISPLLRDWWKARHPQMKVQ